MTLVDPALLRRALVLLLGCLAFVALGLSLSPPAAAHPFGDPQTIEVTTEDGDVRLRWKVGGTDDLTALALHLGLLPADRVMLDGAVLFEDGDAELLAVSPAFSGYLLDRVGVVGNGQDCLGHVLAVDDLLADGAVLSFECGATVDEVTVETSLLTDLHPDYRTLATGPGGQRAVYDGDNPVHTWSLVAASPGTGAAASSAVVQLGSALGVAVAGGVAAAFYVRRRHRREGTATR